MSAKMVQPISENLAIIPYLFRSIRIKMMFKARDKYCLEDKLPRSMIYRFSEFKLMMVFLVYVSLVIIIGVSIYFSVQNFPMTQSIFDFVKRDGSS